MQWHLERTLYTLFPQVRWHKLGPYLQAAQQLHSFQYQILQNVGGDKLSQELADVTIYLIRLADVCGVNLRDDLEEEQRLSVDDSYELVES